jgi:hypothetical protein
MVILPVRAGVLIRPTIDLIRDPKSSLNRAGCRPGARHEGWFLGALQKNFLIAGNTKVFASA